MILLCVILRDSTNFPLGKTNVSTINMIRLIGDIHNQYDKYFDIVKDSEYSIQLGDMSFDYTRLANSSLDFTKHKWIRGNHDHPFQAETCTNIGYLGDYGYFNLNGISFFFLSGAWSIDYKFRREGINWWREEELTQREFDAALELYAEMQPKLVITHAPPQFICEKLGDPALLPFYNVTHRETLSRTGFYLEEMWNVFQPERWYFGHMHRDWQMQYGRTLFTCVDQYKSVDIT